MRRGWLVVAVSCAACNAVFGLGPTASDPGGDRDDDGIVDSDDNCPDVPNADQRDTDNDGQGDACDACPTHAPTRDRDNDGIDDACDPCVLGVNHDEDGDGIFDACDVCPGDPDSDQLDKDGDGIGEVCDGFAINIDRVVFDAFTSLDATRWSALVPWRLADDGDGVVPTAPTSALDALTFEETGVVRIEAGFVVPAVASGTFGVAAGTGATSDRCEVTCTSGACKLSLTTALGVDMVNFAQPTGLVRVSYVREETGTVTMTYANTCALVMSSGTVTTMVSSKLFDLSPEIVSMPDVEVTYVDIAH